jgi:serine/threonine protein kinase
LLKKVNSPHVLKLYDAFQEENYIYLVT